MPLNALLRNIRTVAGSDALVDHIYSDGVGGGSEDTYQDRYFAERVRRKVFRGGQISGRTVKLSEAAASLKSAFQRRYATTGQFQPRTAYHATSSARIASLIAASGFTRAGQKLFGQGAYFFTDSSRADPYAIAGGNAANEGEGMVLEVTLFSNASQNFNTHHHTPGGDRLIFQHQAILVVKNPLVIFPKAVFFPGEKLSNVEKMVFTHHRL